MDLDDLKPVLDLMSQQEGRLIKKIEEVHTDVVETKNEAIKHNGRMRKLELKTHDLERDAASRSSTCNGKFEEIQPTAKTIRIVNALVNKPKTVFFSFVAIIVVVEVLIIVSIISVSIENSKLIELINLWR